MLDPAYYNFSENLYYTYLEGSANMGDENVAIWTVRIPPDLGKQIDAYAVGRAITRSDAIRELLVQALDIQSVIRAVEKSTRPVGLSTPQIADLGASLAFALFAALGQTPDPTVLKDIRRALLKGAPAAH